MGRGMAWSREKRERWVAAKRLSRAGAKRRDEGKEELGGRRERGQEARGGSRRES